MSQRCLAYARNTLDQEVSVGQHRHHGQPDYLIIAANDLAKRFFQRRSA